MFWMKSMTRCPLRAKACPWTASIDSTALTSAPATKDFSPAPVMMTTLTAASSSSSKRAHSNSLTTSRLSALRLWGRSMVTVAMPSAVSTFKFWNSTARLQGLATDTPVGASIREETSPGLPPQVPRVDRLDEEWTGAVFRVLEAVIEDVGDGQHCVETDEVGESQGPHRLVEAELHPFVDVLCRGDALIQSEDRLVEHGDEHPVDDEAGVVLGDGHLLAQLDHHVGGDLELSLIHI